MAAYNSYTGATDTTALANATIDRFIPAKMLAVATYNAQLYNLAEKVDIPAGESNTVTFIKYNHLALPSDPLSEGDSGSATAGTTSRVSCVTEAWGAWQIVSSLGQYIAKGSPADIYAERQGVQAARVLDREIVRQLMGATTVYYPGSITARSGIGANDTMTIQLMRKVRARMKRTGAPFYQGERHVMVAGPEVCADIAVIDPTVINAAIYQKWDLLVSGEIGELSGFRIVESNTIPQLAAVATAPTTGLDSVAGSEVTLATATYYVSVTLNDTDGFETGFYPIGVGRAVDGTAGKQVVTIATPSLPTGYSSFNIYIGTNSAGTDAKLIGERKAAATTYRIASSGTSTNNLTYSTTGRIVGVSPASGVTVHPVFFFGQGFFKCTKIKNITTYRTNGASKSDPLNRFQTLGWVIEGFRACITDQTYGGKIEVASLN